MSNALPAPDTSSQPDSRRWLMLPVVLLAMFMAGFDIWVVNVAGPSLQRDLHVSDAALQLIVGGYAFMYASGMVTGGPGWATWWATGGCPGRHGPGRAVAARCHAAPQRSRRAGVHHRRIASRRGSPRAVRRQIGRMTAT